MPVTSSMARAIPMPTRSGIVPAYRLGRLFRDATGAANKMLAAASERAYYVLAGMALDLRALGAAPIDAVASDGR